ncbi:RDD family protein [Bremerella volcania]|uniref:RDD family protein n=1 Tax=Bremerella volcania TaxID=2527984 RepID=A0A518C4I7_9BACT|nr:RDD family protein [Bremerella volcania]QDU74143.1 RDD family protein [Bremerella volcania]
MSQLHENPFSSPMTEEPMLPKMSQGTPVPAGKGLRFANFFIDNIVLNIVTFGIGMVMGVMLISSGYEVDSQGNFVGVPLWVNIVINFVHIPITLAYYVILEAALGRTLGKLVTGTRVVNAEGNDASFGQVVGRSFARYIPFEVFSFLGQTGRGWHDSLSKTYVVKI